MGKKLLAVGALSLGLVGGLAVPATGAPSEPFQVTCGGVVYTVTSAMPGKFSILQSVDHSTHFIPIAFDLRVIDQAGTVVSHETITRPGKAHQNQSGQTTCTHTIAFEENSEQFTFIGTAQMVQRP